MNYAKLFIFLSNKGEKECRRRSDAGMDVIEHSSISQSKLETYALVDIQGQCRKLVGQFFVALNIKSQSTSEKRKSLSEITQRT